SHTCRRAMISLAPVSSRGRSCWRFFICERADGTKRFPSTAKTIKRVKNGRLTAVKRERPRRSSISTNGASTKKITKAIRDETSKLAMESKRERAARTQPKKKISLIQCSRRAACPRHLVLKLFDFFAQLGD